MIKENRMGTWSASITGNDTALDMIEEYRIAFSYFSVEEGLQKLDHFVRQNFDESDEDEWCAYFYSLADYMWKHGILTDEIRDKAIQMVDSGFGMATWNEAGQSIANKRRKELVKFRDRISSPQCAPKTIKKPDNICTDDIFENGEMIAIQLKTAGKHFLPGDNCDPMTDEEFASCDKKYVVIQKIHSIEQHFSGVMPKLCDRTAVFFLFKGMYDSPEDIDITKLEAADFKSDRSRGAPYFEHRSSMFQFKRRKYKIIGKMECRAYKEEPLSHYLDLGDDNPSYNVDSRLVAAVIDYDLYLKECQDGISKDTLFDLVTHDVFRNESPGARIPKGMSHDQFKALLLERKYKRKEIRDERYIEYLKMIENGAKIYEIHCARTLGYAIRASASGKKTEILLNSTGDKYAGELEEYVHDQLND